MRKLKILLLALLIYLCAGCLTGCWNYREIEGLAIVSGVAIDEDGNGKVIITAEIVNIQQEQKQSKLKPVYMKSVGKTFFDAARGMISLQGKRLYWSHAKLVIISEKLAKEGLVKVVDFINRDPELRSDMWVLVSREKTAGEIFNAEPSLENILSFQLDDAMRAQKSTSKYPNVELYEFIDNLESKEVSTVIPTISLVEVEGKLTPYIFGAAVLKGDKLVGYLNEMEAKSLMWIKDEIKGGLFVVSDIGKNQTNVAMEIKKSKTKVRPVVIEGELSFRVDVAVEVDIGEIMGSDDFISAEGRNILEAVTERQIKRNLDELIVKAQKDYKTDFLGFEHKLHHYMPGVWKSMEKQWEDIFTDIHTSINVDVIIRGSATTKRPVKVGE